MKQSLLTMLILFSFLAQASAYYFRSYQIEDGLSHNSVWTVMQDKEGFLWFGTNDGLNRFDGKSFKIFRKEANNPLSIGDNFIHCLKEDSQDRFFVGTKKGLYIYNRKTEQFHHVNLDRPREDDASINDLFETPEGDIWVATHGQGLYVLNSDLTIKKQYTKTNQPHSLPNNYIWNVVQDYVGNIWLGTAGDGLVHFDAKKDIFTKMSDDENFNIKDQIVYSLFCDVDYNLWIGTASNGLYRYNYRMGKVSNYMHKEAFDIKSIIEYSDHELIMGCDKGLVTFNRKEETTRMLNNEFDNMTDNAIFSIIKDHEGSFWIGTYFGGVNYFSPAINTFAYHYNSPRNSSKKNIVSSFAENDNGLIWIGTYNDGLSLFNSKKGQFEDAHIDVGYHNVQDLYHDDDKLYISLYGQGISTLDLKNRRTQKLSDYPGVKGNISNFVTTIFKSSRDFFMFASEEGATKYYPATKTTVKVTELTGLPIKDITEDYNGAIWFAMHANGLFRLNADDTWDSFASNPDDPQSLPTNNINCVHQDSKFRIWAGTEGNGLVLYNPKLNRFEQSFTSEDGLPSNIVYSIMDDTEGNIWVTTGSGLVKINVDSKTVKSFSYLGDIQKIRYNPKATLKGLDNRLYFGGTNGFIAFHPKDITNNQKKPTVAITDLQITGRDSQVNKETYSRDIVLKRSESTFTYEFISLSYISPAHNNYAYMLDGFDSEWTYTHDTKAYYMNIPPGDYTFKVKATNNDGIWSDELAVSIKVKPPFFASTYMIILYIVVGIGLIALILYRYLKRVDKKNQEKIYKYKTEKEKEIYETKIDFFTNIAHEIRTPLSLITAPLENIILSGDGNNKTKSNLNIIKLNANRLLELINQLLDFRKVEENMFHFKFRYQDVLKVVRDVYNQYSQNAQMNNIDMTLNVPEGVVKSSVDSEAIYKIVSNLVSNAVKYAKSKIEITVEATDNILISVKDDGQGISSKFQDKIFEPFFQVEDKTNNVKAGSGLGLPLSKSLAEKHNGDISIQSEEGKGTLFMLRIPIVEGTEKEETPQTEPEKKIISPEIILPHENTAKIVIAEDNHDLRNFLVSSLNEEFTVFEAENGLEALAILEKEHIDVIISDIMMPEMDGLELCNRVKSDMAYMHIPLILLSAKTDTPTKIEGLNKGADVYLEKPFSFEQLKAQINSIIENRNHIRQNFIQSPLQYFKQNKTENNESAEFIEKLNAQILENMSDEKFTIDNLSEYFFMSRSNFHKKIKTLTGMTPNDYIKLIRLNQSAQMLATGKYKINEVCYLVGFNTPSYFSKCFFEHFGKLPKEFMEQ